LAHEETVVAAVADNWWRANQAAKKLRIEWDNGANGAASNDTIRAMFKEGLDAPDLPAARKIGDVDAAIKAGAKVVEAEYYSPYLSHATMEPMTSTAWFRDDRTLEVWTSTQNGEAALAAAAEAAGLPLEQVEVHKMLVGGGFGRRSVPQDFVRQGVLIAKEFKGKPVKLIWSREEDMQHGVYRPASMVRMKAALEGERGRDAHESPAPHPRCCARAARGASSSRRCGRATAAPTRSRTSRSTTRCATATCRWASGAPRACRTRSTANASSTRWRMRRARTRSPSAWRC
jgi:isoquinoline 1-oxidoreductase beta subunit